MVLIPMQTAAMLSFVGTFALLIGFAFQYDAFPIVAKELMDLVCFRAHEIKVNNTSFLEMVAIISAAIVVEYLLAMAAAIISFGIAGPKVGQHALSRKNFVEELYRAAGFTPGRSFYRGFIFTMLLEELYARVFFLHGIPTVFSIALGSLWWYVLFGVGNGSWALIHLLNFKDPVDRHPIRTLPQFVGGVVFTYIYVKWGFVAALLMHIGANSVLFCFNKQQRITPIDLAITLTWFAIGYWGWAHLDKPITDILVWFDDQPAFALAGWTRTDYLNMSLFLAGAVNGGFGLLMYDRHNVLKDVDPRKPYPEPSKDKVYLIIELVVGLIVVLVVGLGSIAASVAGLRFVVTTFQSYFMSMPMLLVFTALVWSLRLHADSVSAIARIFWSILPAIYISTCVIMALEFWDAVYYVVAIFFWTLPVDILKLYDD